jgi:Tfp pilus assembly protein PilO
VSELVVIVVVAMVVLGVFGRSSRSAPDVSGLNRTVRDLQSQLDAALAELDQHRQQVAELAERLDFAERRLVQMQSVKPLPPPST